METAKLIPNKFDATLELVDIAFALKETKNSEKYLEVLQQAMEVGKLIPNLTKKIY